MKWHYSQDLIYKYRDKIVKLYIIWRTIKFLIQIKYRSKLHLHCLGHNCFETLFYFLSWLAMINGPKQHQKKFSFVENQCKIIITHLCIYITSTTYVAQWKILLILQSVLLVGDALQWLQWNIKQDCLFTLKSFYLSLNFDVHSHTISLVALKC